MKMGLRIGMLRSALRLGAICSTQLCGSLIQAGCQSKNYRENSNWIDQMINGINKDPINSFSVLSPHANSFIFPSLSSHNSKLSSVTFRSPIPCKSLLSIFWSSSFIARRRQRDRSDNAFSFSTVINRPGDEFHSQYIAHVF